ncbi:hypothetical protein [Mycolicibacterium vaccae]|uniref:Uncharacterized protein n=1 Tax=Mycolicibacterium vaccae ATCC 25954 TaxID=1194972 RepID=K0UKI5_MYCVA|nr:hypothetical protein [Mycolicibacterium vaccae]EJZ05465.1 hypothetical protein MVAC_25115 [Mycolicibacterium vaccae ATCC 25954]MCV7063916.1 hypothetical protein [Mycolicibacterium vaccae]
MTQRISRYLGAAVVAAAAVAPLAASALSAPVTSTAQCPPGQTGVIYGCAPFCVEGKYLDTQTGLCMPIAPPPPSPTPRY